MSALTNTEVMLVPDNINPADYGLQTINTITGRICQKAGIGRNRSFNMHTVADENDGLWHTEYSGYESPFVPNAILANYLHKLHYGKPVSESIEAYLDTKLDRMNGNFDKRYLRQTGSSNDILSAGNPVELTNEDLLLARLPLSIHNPVISPKGQVRLDKIRGWIETQHYFRIRSFGGSIVNMVLFEDDPARYEALPSDANGFDIYNDENTENKTGLSVYNNIIRNVEGSSKEAVVECFIKEPGRLKLIIFDSKGREILILFDEHLNSGIHRFTWDGSDSSGKKIGSGVYMVHMRAGSYKETKKIVIVK